MVVKDPIVPVERIERSILLIRGQKVMLSPNLAELYQVEPRVLLQAVKRNIDRFPKDFMFQLSWKEVKLLRSQNVILETIDSRSKKGKHTKYLPYAFTEQGVAMLSSVLKSKRAVQVNIEIMRAFVKLRQIIASNIELAHKLDELEKKYDSQFKVVFEATRQLMQPPKKKRNPSALRQVRTEKSSDWPRGPVPAAFLNFAR